MMNFNPSHPHPNSATSSADDLDRALRAGAHQRRAWLDRQVYPVGDYPPRGAGVASTPTAIGPGVWRWLVLLGGGAGVAAVGLAVVLMNSTSTPPPAVQPFAGGSAAGGVESPARAADWSRQSVYRLLQGLDRVEVDVNRGVSPAVSGAASLPGQLAELPRWIGSAEAGLQAPLQQEWVNLRADWQTATDYVRQHWQGREAAPSSRAVPGRTWPGGAGAA